MVWRHPSEGRAAGVGAGWGDGKVAVTRIRLQAEHVSKGDTPADLCAPAQKGKREQEMRLQLWVGIKQACHP